MRRRDYKVPFKSDQTIAGIVEEFRERAGISQSSRFDITKILRWLTQVDIPYKGKLHIKSLEGDRTDPYVMFKPLRLHVCDEMMEHASWGDPDSQFKLGHETGHIILHDHYAQAFSFDPALQVKYAQDEESAEWQANRFAYHLLLPDKFVRIFQGDIRQIIEACGVLE